PRVEAELMQPVLEEPCVRPQALQPVGLVADDLERLDARRDDRRRLTRREQVGTATVLQPVDQLVLPCDEPSEQADRLRERPDLDVDAAVQPEVIDGAGTTRAENA